MPPSAITEPVAIKPAVVQEAADWLARLWADDAGADTERACAAWRAQKPEHELAWQRLQQINARFNSVPRAIGQGTLRAPRHQTRRSVLRMLGWGIVAGGAVGIARDSELWHYSVADHSTGTGAWKQLRLADGTELMLNTSTAVDIAYDATSRRVRLHAGEIYISTAPDPQRPFLVETQDGTLRALGTRYSVRKLDGGTQVAVYEHAVEIAPHDSRERLRLSAGRQAVLNRDTIQASTGMDAGEPGWTRRRLVAERMRLADFLAEIGRYRHGVLRCDPRVAELRLTGVYPLDDTDRALATLEESLPVKLEWTTRYWLSVQPRETTQA